MSRLKLTLTPPKPIYWFEATENKEHNLSLLEYLEDLSGVKVPQEDREYAIKEMMVGYILYNHEMCIVSDNMCSNKGTMIRLFGTEITLEDE